MQFYNPEWYLHSIVSSNLAAERKAISASQKIMLGIEYYYLLSSIIFIGNTPMQDIKLISYIRCLSTECTCCLIYMLRSTLSTSNKSQNQLKINSFYDFIKLVYFLNLESMNEINRIFVAGISFVFF